eukprot:scaffold225481_cov20-Prasinocladus_malaysianus.AAC.1
MNVYFRGHRLRPPGGRPSKPYIGESGVLCDAHSRAHALAVNLAMREYNEETRAANANSLTGQANNPWLTTCS